MNLKQNTTGSSNHAGASGSSHSSQTLSNNSSQMHHQRQESVLQELQQFFETEKNLCLSLASLIARSSDKGYRQHSIKIVTQGPFTQAQSIAKTSNTPPIGNNQGDSGEYSISQSAVISPSEVKLKLNVNDDFKIQASSLLLQRVTTEFLFNLSSNQKQATTELNGGQGRNTIKASQQQQQVNSIKSVVGERILSYHNRSSSSGGPSGTQGSSSEGRTREKSPINSSNVSSSFLIQLPSKQSIAEAEFFIKSLIQAIAMTDQQKVRSTLTQLICNLLINLPPITNNSAKHSRKRYHYKREGLHQQHQKQFSSSEGGTNYQEQNNESNSSEDYQERKIENAHQSVCNHHQQNIQSAGGFDESNKTLSQQDLEKINENRGEEGEEPTKNSPPFSIIGENTNNSSSNHGSGIGSNSGATMINSNVSEQVSVYITKKIVKIIMTTIISEIQNCEDFSKPEYKKERILETLLKIIQVFNASPGELSNSESGGEGGGSPLKTLNFSQHVQRHTDFLLEYFLQSLLFILQNRKNTQLIKFTLQIISAILNQANINQNLQCIMGNLIEVISYYFCDEDLKQKSQQHKRKQTVVTDLVKIEALKLLTVILTRDHTILVGAHEQQIIDLQDFISTVKDADPEMALVAIEFWDQLLPSITNGNDKDEYKKQVFEQLLPLLLEQCKMKSEDFEKFKKDKLNAEILEKRRSISRMTIRSKAAKTIENIASQYQKEVFFALRTHLELYLNSKESWFEKEAAVLVIGVICGIKNDLKAIESQASQLIPFLINELSSSTNPTELKATTCWTLSNFNEWLLNQTDTVNTSLIPKYIDVILSLVLDKDKGVQKSALSNLQNIVQHEKSLQILKNKLPSITDIMSQLFKSVDHYTLMSLCDLIYHLCNQFKENAMDFAFKVLPNLVDSLDLLNQEHANSIFSLLDCLFACITVLGPNVPVFAHKIISGVIQLGRPQLFKYKEIHSAKRRASSADDHNPIPSDHKIEEEKQGEEQEDDDEEYEEVGNKHSKNDPVKKTNSNGGNGSSNEDLNNPPSNKSNNETESCSSTSEWDVPRKVLELIIFVVKSIDQQDLQMQTIHGISPELVQFFQDCFTCENVSIILDSLSNFIEILPIIADQTLFQNGQQIVSILLENIKKTIEQVPFTVNSNSNSNSDSNGKFSETFDEQYNRVMICNNACWLVGELAMRIPNQIVPLLTQVIDLLADILNLELFEKLENGLDQLLKCENENLDNGVIENQEDRGQQEDNAVMSPANSFKQNLRHLAKTLSITIGRLGRVQPQTTAYCLPRIIKPWCLALRYISGSEEKAQAFRGLCAMIPFNPVGISESFPYFCEALVEFKDPNSDLEYIFLNLIQTYKVCLGEEAWEAYLASFPLSLKEDLTTRFSLQASNAKGQKPGASEEQQYEGYQ